MYAGDTDTLIKTKEEEKIVREEKKRREEQSFQKIKDKFLLTFPYMIELMKNYEKQEDLESIFVKIVDKVVPKFTKILNHNKQLKDE